jgi:hypothetical protein
MPNEYETSKPTAGEFDFLYNPNVDSTQRNAFAAEQQYYNKYGEYIDKLKKYAANYPDFRKTLIANGYMRSDGSIDASKLTDKDYLQNLDRVWKEDIINQTQSLQQASQNQGQRQGGIQSTASLRAINDSMAGARRNALNDYVSKYKQEKEMGYGKAMGLTQKDLNSQLGAMNMDIGAGEQETNRAMNFMRTQGDTANAQSKGLFQDPERVMKTAAGIGAMFIPGGQIAGAGLLAGGMTPNDQQKQASALSPSMRSQTNMGSPQMVAPDGNGNIDIGKQILKALGLMM